MQRRSSDVVEVHSERALATGIGGLVALAGALLFFAYGGESMRGLAYVLLVVAIALLGYAGYCAMQIRKVASVGVKCVYCNHNNRLTEQPTDDFTCQACFRLIPVVNGQPIPVSQVRCGFCNELNYYSAKTEVLLCESCNREVPVAHDGPSTKQISRGFAVQDDDRPYELVLTGQGHRTEELIEALQHMLALNRNQVKQMLEGLPIVLLSGIPKKKAEMLQAQLALHEGYAEYKPVA